jgi:hypothetical protein
MPSRIIRPGINDSAKVDQLDWAAEVFYRRLLNVVDDYGLYDARSQKLRADLFPLRLDKVREADIQRWIAACVKAGLVVLYVVSEASGQRRFAECDEAGAVRLSQDEKPYIKVFNTKWKSRSEPKFPRPPEGNHRAQLKTVARNCDQLRAYSGTETETYSETNARTGTAPPAAAEPDDDPPEVHAARRILKTSGLKDTVSHNSPAWMRLVELVRACGEPIVGLAVDKAVSHKRLYGKRAVDYASTIAMEERAKADAIEAVIGPPIKYPSPEELANVLADTEETT